MIIECMLKQIYETEKRKETNNMKRTYHYSIRTNVGMHSGECTMDRIMFVISDAIEDDMIKTGMETSVKVESMFFFENVTTEEQLIREVGKAVYSYYKEGILTWEDIQNLRGKK